MTRRIRPLEAIYGQTSLALLTDLYQLTMAYANWKTGNADKEGVFHLYFRRNPFQGGFSIACGLTHTLDYLERFRFTKEDVDYIATLTGNDGQPLFEQGFLDYLSGMRLTLDIDAVPEGTVVFPHEPMYRVKGNLIQATLLETPLLTLNGFPSLVATKSARVKLAAKGDPVLDFGLRRAQGIDGALMASWAAYLGGADATSNMLAGRLFGIPCRGTHAHSWVMSFDRGRRGGLKALDFDDEYESFMTYAQALPNNCVFLVDTYGTLDGIRKAVEVGKWLRSQGFEMIGVRLDSGDLAYLSKEGRKILDRGSFKKAKIFASNDLDERSIFELKSRGAKIAVWGVGTKLITAYDQPAMGVVYKLAAWRAPGSQWHYPVKLSEEAIKVSTPGLQQVRRYYRRNHFLFDMIVNTQDEPAGSCYMIDPLDHTRRKHISAKAPFEELLVPVVRGGTVVYDRPTLATSRERAARQLSMFDRGIKTLVGEPEYVYPVGLEEGLYRLKTDLILKARGLSS